MTALRFSTFGGPEVLSIESVPCPTPAPDEALVKVVAGGLNFADTERRRGLYLAHAPLPDTLGFEGAGVVVEAGANVPTTWISRRVAFLAPKAHASYCVVQKDNLFPLPDEVSFAQGAALPIQGLTAWQTLHTLGKVQAGETVLVHSAVGGVGHVLVQLATHAGATVIGTVSRPGKIPASLAPHTLVRGPEFLKALLHLTPQGVDLLLDGLGAEAAQTASEALRPWGRWVHYGTASGEMPPTVLKTLFEKSLTFSSYWLRTLVEPGARQRIMEELFQRLASNRLTLAVTPVVLREAQRAHRRMESGLSTGKWIFVIDEEAMSQEVSKQAT